ncbi:MAG: hypothetical protein ACYDDI_01075 [Candidatus Acidiferrales bacterium]
MIENLESFEIRTDDGEVLRVLVIQRQIEIETFKENYSISGIGELLLEDGRHVNRINEQRFQIVETGEFATRI